MKYWKFKDWLRFIARIIYLPFILLKDFVMVDSFPSRKALKNYLFDDFIEGKWLAQRKAGW